MRFNSPFLLCLALLGVPGQTLAIETRDGYSEGFGTTFDLTNSADGACHITNPKVDATTKYAAINDIQWDKSKNCGRCVEVSAVDVPQTTTMTMQILDSCPKCRHGDLRLSQSALKELSGGNPTISKIRWRFVNCP